MTNRISVESGVQLRRGAAVMAVLMLFWITGCATAGRDFPTQPVHDIEIGKTSRGEVRQMFGPPWRVGVENGQTTWTYGKYRYRLIGETSTTDLVIKFDDKGRVSSYTYNTTEHPDTR